MPGRRHPAAEFPLPLLASLAAPRPARGGLKYPATPSAKYLAPTRPPLAPVRPRPSASSGA